MLTLTISTQWLQHYDREREADALTDISFLSASQSGAAVGCRAMGCRAMWRCGQWCGGCEASEASACWNSAAGFGLQCV